MVEMRRTSARIKADPGLKRRFSDALEETPSKPVKAAKTSTKTTPKTAILKTSPAIEEPVAPVLPTKLADSTPLPVLREPQSDNLQDAEWQSIGDSGVFAASLARARLAIAKGTYFDKYWTKPTMTKKQKDMTEEEKLQLKAAKGPTQSKVGAVKMISEPLAFDVQLLMIKDQNAGYRIGQLPPEKQHLIYGTPQRTASPAYTTPYRPPVQQQPMHTPTRPAASITPSTSTPRPHIAGTPSQPGPSHTQPRQNPSAAPRPSAASPRPAGSASNPQAPDPVIHALAQRASANPELKAVMKIVATGRASQQQLQYFQKHIDELTEMVRQRQEQETRARAPAPPPPARPAPAQPIRPPAAPQTAKPQPSQGIAPIATPAPRPPPTPSPTQYYHHPAPVAPRPKMVTTATPLHVLIQFNENPNERFLFPKYSILEFSSNLQEVICSFVVLKKKIGEDKNYWVPVTLTFKGDAPTLSVLGRVAEPVEAARRYMEDIMLKYDRAEDGFLAFRLPREPMAIESN